MIKECLKTIPAANRAVCILVAIACWACAAEAPASTKIPCKYSVRDVAFVNVHGKAWQLQLIKPEGTTEDQFELWNIVLNDKLPQSNLGWIWLDSSEMPVPLPDAASGSMPWMVLSDGKGQKLEIDPDPNISFEQQIDLLLESPTRKKIFEHVVESLCVLVFIESGDVAADQEARELAQAAIEQQEKQMWTLEKATDHGPVLVTISIEQRQQELWLIQSLGIESIDAPTFAIVYGQGRRLGDILTSEQATVSQLVGRMSICGQDCECELDRKWLYGQQILHVWNKSLERAAEQSLSFDPRSGFVVAEVAQIIKKNSTQPFGSDQINLGAGLIIHDLDDTDSQPVDLTIEEPAGSSQKTESQPEPVASAPDASVSDRPTDDASNDSGTVPWTLISVMLVAVFVLFAILKMNSKA